MTRWTWKELRKIVAHEGGAHMFESFIKQYGYPGVLALEIAKFSQHEINPYKWTHAPLCQYMKKCSKCILRSFNRPLIGSFCTSWKKEIYSKLVEEYRKEYQNV